MIAHPLFYEFICLILHNIYFLQFKTEKADYHHLAVAVLFGEIAEQVASIQLMRPDVVLL